MNTQLPAPMDKSKRSARVAAYMERFAELPLEEQLLHFRIALHSTIAVLKGSKTPLLDAVAGEREEIQALARKITSIDADDYSVGGEADM